MNNSTKLLWVFYLWLWASNECQTIYSTLDNHKTGQKTWSNCFPKVEYMEYKSVIPDKCKFKQWASPMIPLALCIRPVFEPQSSKLRTKKSKMVSLNWESRTSSSQLDFTGEKVIVQKGDLGFSAWFIMNNWVRAMLYICRVRL